MQKIFLYIFGGIGALLSLAMLIWFLLSLFRQTGQSVGRGLSCLFQGIFFSMGLLFIAIGVFVIPWMITLTGGDQVQAFMQAVEDQDPDAAIGLLTEHLQSDLGGRQGFADWFRELRLEGWNMTSSCANPKQGRIDGHARSIETGKRVSITFFMHKDGKWRIQGMAFWELEPKYHVGQFNSIDCSDD